MIFDKDKNSLELEIGKDEAKKLVHLSEEFHPDELEPEISDFFGRLQFASAGANWGADRWRELKVGEQTGFSLSESGNVEISGDELVLLQSGLQKIIQEPRLSPELTQIAIEAKHLLDDGTTQDS